MWVWHPCLKSEMAPFTAVRSQLAMKIMPARDYDTSKTNTLSKKKECLQNCWHIFCYEKSNFRLHRVRNIGREYVQVTMRYVMIPQWSRKYYKSPLYCSPKNWLATVSTLCSFIHTGTKAWQLQTISERPKTATHTVNINHKTTYLWMNAT